MSAYLYNEYEIKSNQESGKARSDIILKARKEELPSYILEFKYTKDKEVHLETIAKEAIEQIIEKRYDSGIKGKVIYRVSTSQERMRNYMAGKEIIEVDKKYY